MWTSLIMAFIKYVCRVPLRMSDEKLEVGDFAIHGEEPYMFAHYNRDRIEGINNGDTRHKVRDEEKGSSDGSGVIMGTDPHAGRVEEVPAMGPGPSVKRD